jgi:hypothetical protein
VSLIISVRGAAIGWPRPAASFVVAAMDILVSHCIRVFEADSTDDHLLW